MVLPRDGARERCLTGVLRHGLAGNPPDLGKFQQGGEAGRRGGSPQPPLTLRNRTESNEAQPPPPSSHRLASNEWPGQTHPPPSGSLTSDISDEGEPHEQLHPPPVDGGQQAQQRPLAHHAQRHAAPGARTAGHATGLGSARLPPPGNRPRRRSGAHPLSRLPSLPSHPR